jgi:Acyl-coenzyme A:6-aminopenicillanic acid acyl-transferase
VLSGMLPGAYSVTINWAPPGERPSFDFGPAFLLRDALETCDGYETAVRRLSETRLSTSVFFTICGAAKSQACVIERTQHDAVIRPMSETPLVQANHHVAGQFGKNNEDLLGAGEEDVFSLAGSRKRADTLSGALTGIPSSCTLDQAAQALDTIPVLNADTCQQMVFCPERGEVRVWRKVPQT